MLERVTQCVCPVGSISALLLLIIVHKKSFLIPGLPFGPWHNWVASSLIPVNDTQGVGEVSVLHRTLNQNKYVKRGSCGPCFCGQFVAQPSLFVRQVAGMVSHDEGDNTSRSAGPDSSQSSSTHDLIAFPATPLRRTGR